MKKLIIGSFLSASLLAQTLGAYTLVCFTANEPVDSPEIIQIGDREIYFSYENESYSIVIASNGVKKPALSCSVNDEMGIGMSLQCGNEKLLLDLPNNRGSIKRTTDSAGEYGQQTMVCRDLSMLTIN